MRQIIVALLLIIAGAAAGLWLFQYTGAVSLVVETPAAETSVLLTNVIFEIPDLPIRTESTLAVAAGVFVVALVLLTLIVRLLGSILSGILGLFGLGPRSARPVDKQERASGVPETNPEGRRQRRTATGLLFIIGVIAVAALGVLWVIENDVEPYLTLVFFDQTIQLTQAETILYLAALVAAVVAVFRIVAWIVGIPGRWNRAPSYHLQQRDQAVILEGLLAVAGQDLGRARRMQRAVTSESEDSPAYHLLSAQIAQLGGDSAAVQRHSRAMLNNRATEVSGLQLLFEDAVEKGKVPLAISYAEQILERREATPALIVSLVDLYARGGDWEKLKSLVRKPSAVRAIGAKKARRLTLIAEYSLAVTEAKRNEMDKAKAHLKQALTMDSSFLPANIALVDLLIREGDTKQAEAQIRRAWSKTPSPELAERFLALHRDASPSRQLGLVQRLVSGNRTHPHSAALVARIALNARMPGKAREVLAAAMQRNNTATVARLMLEAQAASGAPPEVMQHWASRAATASPDPVQTLDTDIEIEPFPAPVYGAPAPSAAPVPAPAPAPARPVQQMAAPAGRVITVPAQQARPGQPQAALPGPGQRVVRG